MSLCFITFLTSSLKQLHRFNSNFVLMFPGWIPTTFVKIGVLPLIFIELREFCKNFSQLLKIFYKTTDN